MRSHHLTPAPWRSSMDWLGVRTRTPAQSNASCSSVDTLPVPQMAVASPGSWWNRDSPGMTRAQRRTDQEYTTMETQMFDGLAKTFGRTSTRRSAVRGLVAGAL